MAAILFLPFESRTEVFLTSSLGRFLRKAHKNILFMPKRSRLAEEKSPVWLSKSVRELAI
jgi:hypothetical protein